MFGNCFCSNFQHVFFNALSGCFDSFSHPDFSLGENLLRLVQRSLVYLMFLVNLQVAPQLTLVCRVVTFVALEFFRVLWTLTLTFILGEITWSLMIPAWHMSISTNDVDSQGFAVFPQNMVCVGQGLSGPCIWDHRARSVWPSVCWNW